jgi:triphosphatase
MSDNESQAGETPREVELKLDCAGPDLTVLAAHPRLQEAGPSERELLVTTYYDTPDRDLRRAGLTLRVRAQGGRHLQTVKAGGGDVGLFDRAEWETEIAGDTPDAKAWAGTAAEPVLREAEAPLERLFATIIMRREIPVEQGASRIMVTLDEGRVESAAGDAPLCGLELELKAGEPADLFGLAQALAETVPLRLSVASKSAAGFALIDGTGPAVVKAQALDLPEDASAGEVFRLVARACLRHMRLNETAFLEGGRAPEALHQIRVSLRRLRSALSLFAPMLEGDSRAAGFNDEIKRVTEPFGHARNLDVFLGQTLPDLAEARPDDPALEGLRERAEGERERAYDAVLATLESPQWRGLIIDFAGWIEAGPWTSSAAGAASSGWTRTPATGPASPPRSSATGPSSSRASSRRRRRAAGRTNSALSCRTCRITWVTSTTWRRPGPCLKASPGRPCRGRTIRPPRTCSRLPRRREQNSST